MNHKQPTFFFHDYETFGKHPVRDRPAQFAGIRTDMNFNFIEEPIVFYCAPACDYLPDPQAVLMTGITPQHALAKGINEAQFSRQIHHAFSTGGTCILGYNNIRFDDEVSRHLFYRNFYDPYAYSWQNGNSRWDLLDVLRACYALRPQGIIWPQNEEGLPSFKLEHLTQANGVEHLQAHDAASDVHATIAMTKLLKQAQPRLFDYFFHLRNKHKINELIDIVGMTPLVHVSGMFGAAHSYTSLIAPLAWHPENKNAVIVCNLAANISVLLELTSDALRERLYTRKDELSPDQSPVPIKLVHINKCPVLAPINSLRSEDSERIGIDSRHCMKNLQLLRQYPQIREKVVAIFNETEAFPVSDDVDEQLYEGFFGTADRATMNIIQGSAPQNLATLAPCFQDNRLAELFFRYRARNYPHTLNESEQQRWLRHCRESVSPQRIQHYLLQLAQFYHEYENDERKLELLNRLRDYARQLPGHSEKTG